MPNDVIRLIRVTHHQVPPFDVPVWDSTMGPFDRLSPSVLRVRTDAQEGFALTTPIESEIVRDALAPLIVGQPASAWPLLRERCFWAIRNLGHAGLAMNALSSLDIALFDLIGRLEGTPLWKRWGPAEGCVAVYGSGGWVNLSTGQLVNAMMALVDRGFTTLKMKIGVDFGRRSAEDVRRVRAVRDAIGPDIALAVDANQCWDAETALRVAHEIADFNIAWFEEPVFAYDRQACAAVRRSSPIPIAAGESERLAMGFRELIAHHAADVLQPQPMVCGGVTGWREAAALASAAGLSLNCGGCSFFTCQLLATAANPGLCEYLVPFMDALQDCFKEHPVRDGHGFRLNSLPGNGLRLDEEYLRTHPGAMGWERS